MTTMRTHATTTTAPPLTARLVHDEPLLSAADALEHYGAELQAEPGRLALWQLMHAAVEASQALRAHARSCASPSGALAAIAEADPVHAAAVRTAWDEHQPMIRQANSIVLSANALSEPRALDAAVLRGEANELARRLRAHRSRATALVYEAALRDIGGEG